MKEEQSLFLMQDESLPQSSMGLSEDDTANRFVAFLDIMGFKDRVARTAHDDLRGQLLDFNSRIMKHTKLNDKKIQLAQFSDSIVLFSNDDSLESLEIMAQVSRSIMRDAISCQIPLKGAIAQGKITCDIAKQLFFGQALIDAYLLEESIHYYGVLVHHSAEESVERLKKKTDVFFKDIKAPLKSGLIGHYELSWYADSMKDTVNLEKTCADLHHIRSTVSDAPRRYIDNTLWVIDEFYKTSVGNALKEGRAEGERNKQIEIARKMKQAGMDAETIVRLTGLATDDIDVL